MPKKRIPFWRKTKIKKVISKPEEPKIQRIIRKEDIVKLKDQKQKKLRKSNKKMS